MLKSLTFIRENLLYFILGSMVLGLGFGALQPAGFLKPAVLPILLLMVYPMMVNIKIEEVAHAFTDLRSVGLSLLINFGLMPLLAWTVAAVFLAASPCTRWGSTSSPCCPPRA